MWLLSLIPTSFLTLVTNFILLVGIVGTIGSFFITLPSHTLHRVLVQVICIPLLITGVFWKGGLEIEKSWRNKVDELQEKVRIAEKKAEEKNVEIEYIIQEKVQVVKDTQVIIQEKIRDISVQIDDQCLITLETIDILNSAAQNKLPGGRE